MPYTPPERYAIGYHQHRASCHGPIGELQCGQAARETLAPYSNADAQIASALIGPRDGSGLTEETPKKTLHPMQWVTYIIVCITCLVVMYAMLETYLFVQDFRDWVNQLGKAFSDNLGVN